MVEAGAHEVPEDVVLEAIKFGHQHIVNLVEFQEEIVKQIGTAQEGASSPWKLIQR